MRGLRGALWKDLRLLRGGTGLACLLLPVLLLLALTAGGGDLLKTAYVEPFPIALRDEDQTVMSRSLVGQLQRVELFSEVRVPTEEETDKKLLDGGCAAVLTLPRDFFYTAYRMEESTVRVVLNEKMPLEAALLRGVLSSVMDIMGTGQAVDRAVFAFTGGDSSELHYYSANQLLADALGRQQIFDTGAAVSDLAGSLMRGYLACALAVLCLFFPLAAVKTLPEELGSGVLPRFLAAGGTAGAFFCSKFLTALLLTLPALALLLPFFPEGRLGQALVLSGLLFLAGFGLLLALALWVGEAGAAQRWGNLLLLLSLMLGGAIYPAELLPEWAERLGCLTLPYYAREGLELIGGGVETGKLVLRLWPLLLMAFGGLVLAVPALMRNRNRAGTIPAPEGEPVPTALPSAPCRRRRLGAVTLWKTYILSGGRLGLLALMGTALLCGGLSACALSGQRVQALRLAVVEEAPDALSRDLVDRLSTLDGVAVQVTDREKGQDLLKRGRVEGLLTICSGYGETLTDGTGSALRYESAAPAFSAQAAREIIGGQAGAQKAVLRGLALAEERLGRPLTGGEQQDLLADMEREAASAPALCTFETRSGGAAGPADPFVPSPLGGAALAVMLTLFTWAAWTGSVDARRVEQRLCAQSGGRGLAYGSDVLALLLVGLGTGACVLLPAGVPDGDTLAALAAYTAAVTGLALALGRLTALSGRMDALAPFLALITCLLGGCFGDLGQVSPLLRRLSLLTPQGLALEAQRGGRLALGLLLAGAALLLLLGAPSREGKEL